MNKAFANLRQNAVVAAYILARAQEAREFLAACNENEQEIHVENCVRSVLLTGLFRPTSEATSRNVANRLAYYGYANLAKSVRNRGIHALYTKAGWRELLLDTMESAIGHLSFKSQDKADLDRVLSLHETRTLRVAILGGIIRDLQNYVSEDERWELYQESKEFGVYLREMEV